MNNKHAFLIMAYDDFDFLKELLQAIDDERNDIYLHIDRRAKFCVNDFYRFLNKSKLYSVRGIKVIWGSEDQIIAEMKLLKASTEKQNYLYYHLISGHDFPLVSQADFHNFFMEHKGIEFIDCRYINIDPMLFRIRYYFPFQTLLTGKSILNRLMNKIGVMVQSILNVSRLSNDIVYGYGGNWFSITDDFARYIVSMEPFVKTNFGKGLCADEMFVQTLWLNSPFKDVRKIFKNEPDFSDLEQNYRNALRAVDFLSGTGVSPCTFDEKDYDILMQSNCIFARKLDSKHSKGLIKKIKDGWRI